MFSTVAGFAVSVLCAVVCVLCAAVCWKGLRRVRELPSMNSFRAELHEIRDYSAKLDAWAKRINSRLAMANRRAAEDPDTEPEHSDPVALKARLRKIAGIVPGQPARHRE